MLALLVLPVACKMPGRGARVPDPVVVKAPPAAPGGSDVSSQPGKPPAPPVVVDERCGPQPSPKQVERLVRQEHPGGAARDFSYSKLERWRVIGDRQVWGWRVVVDITRENPPRPPQTNRHAYVIRKQDQGFAIIAVAKGEADSARFEWTLRKPDREARKQAEREELERLRLAWARAREVPTMEELVSADFGTAPNRYRDKIQEHLREQKHLTESTRLRLDQPVKTWARRVGSGETVFGWRVTATVIGQPDAAGERMKRFHFMFRGSDVISTTRLGKGFRLVVEGEPPEPPPAETPATPEAPK